MLYISNIFNVDTKEHYDRIKSFTQAQMMYCVELRDFTTGEQRAMCMPRLVTVGETSPFGVDNLGLCLYEASLHPSRVSGNTVNIVDVIVQYNQRHPEYDLLHSRDFYFSYENTQVLGKKIYHITFDKDLSLELTKYAIKWRLV